MNLNDAIEIARANAVAALDQMDAYDDSIASHRQNVRDTLGEMGGTEFEADAFAAFDAITKVASAKQEAIEVADANLNNVCLPTYSEVVAALGKLVGAVDRMKANAADGIADDCRELLNKVRKGE